MASRRQFFQMMLGSFSFLLPRYFRSPSSAAATSIFNPAAVAPEKYWEFVREQFPQPKDEVFFNNGTLGAMPTPVVEKVVDSLQELNRTIARWDYRPNHPRWFTGYAPENEIREKMARIVHCDVEELALTQNATMGMNEIAMGLDLQPGDEVIQTDQEHPGGSCGWLVREKRHGIVYKTVKIPVPPNDPGEIIQRFADALTPKTRVLAIPHITSALGTILPVKEIVQMYKQRGAFTVIDGAQAVGQIPVDVKDLGCDAYFSSPHKWLLAPAGNGLLYVNKESAPNIWTILASSQWDNQKDPGYRLQQRGTGSLPLLIGLGAAADFFFSIGPERWLSRIKELGDRLRAGLQKIDGVEIYSSVHPKMCAGMTTYRVTTWKAAAMQDFFWEKRKMRPRAINDRLGVRHSVHIYHSEAEIDAALEVVQEMAATPAPKSP
ncbi:MAG: aminotransferase class V-fold PLP-dependent enzyme [candidate division KSB1 bacterium]|nr:aminotransferase class V-fold PLP-dependent enzyme [candidate division KSB1 bacterium]